MQKVNMKISKKYFAKCLILSLMLSILGGCGGYAAHPGSTSGVQVYGTVDVGVTHESR
jgi:hypothetical protein